MPYFSAGGQRWIAYRKVYELANGVVLLASQLMCHGCDQGAYPVGCCNPKHVRIGTPQNNVDDAKLRQRFGLPKSVVRNIRTLLEKGHTQQNVADTYGVSRETISAIYTGRTYSYVPQYEEDDYGPTSMLDR
jgi:DNA-binding XRE family transcriptional regulator